MEAGQLTLNWGMFFTLMLSSRSLPSAMRMSCWWPTSNVGHCWTRPMVLPEGWRPVPLPATKASGLCVNCWPPPTISACCCWLGEPVPLAANDCGCCDCWLDLSHLDVLKRHTFSFRHQLQPQLVVRQSLQLFCFVLFCFARPVRG